MSLLTTITCLDNVSMTLKARDANKINLIMTFANILNATVWLLYGLDIEDFYIIITTTAALMAGVTNLFLYMWTMGQMQNSHWFILFLQRNFNAKG